MSRAQNVLAKSAVSNAFADYVRVASRLFFTFVNMAVKEASKRQMATPSPTGESGPSGESAPAVPSSAPSFRKPTFVVHWPEEMAGADYQKLMAIEPGTGVKQLLDKALNAPVAQARGPWDAADWALWVEVRSIDAH